MRTTLFWRWFMLMPLEATAKKWLQQRLERWNEPVECGPEDTGATVENMVAAVEEMPATSLHTIRHLLR